MSSLGSMVMSEGGLDTLEPTPYALLLECKNGITSDNFQHAINEALWGLRHIKRNYPIEHVETGVVFTKNYCGIDNRKNALDYFVRIKQFQHLRSIRAVERTLHRPERNPLIPLDVLVPIVLEELRSGTSLEDIFYPDIDELKRLVTAHPQLPSHADEYGPALGQLKGATVEEYVALHFENAVPKTTIIRSYEYKHKKRTVDIDLILIGDRCALRNALLNSRDMTPFSTSGRQPKQRYHNPARGGYH